MEKRSLINLGLLVVMLLLATLVWFTTDDNGEKRFQPLTGLNPSTIGQITLANNNGPTFTLQRGPSGWTMTTPYQVEANVPRINILLDIVSTPSFEQHPAPADRLKEFGLDKPRAELLLNDTKLVFGGTHPYNYRRYVLIDGTLHLTNDNFPHHFLALAEDFISHSLLKEGSRVEQIRTPGWRLFHTGQGWQLDPPVEGISADQLLAKVSDWENTWVSKVQKSPVEPATEFVEVSIQGSQRPIRFGLINTERELLLVRDDLGLAYRLPAASKLLESPKRRD
ncbi:MAG: DUF4340 domain-containing protein [Candidatus Sedimenticola sp. 4PFRAG1]